MDYEKTQHNDIDNLKNHSICVWLLSNVNVYHVKRSVLLNLIDVFVHTNDSVSNHEILFHDGFVLLILSAILRYVKTYFL